MRIREDGRLVVNFRTEARFRGCFVLDHAGADTESSVSSPDHRSVAPLTTKYVVVAVVVVIFVVVVVVVIFVVIVDFIINVIVDVYVWILDPIQPLCPDSIQPLCLAPFASR